MWIGWIEEMLLMELVLTIFSSLTDQDGIKCKGKAVGTITRLVEVIIECIGGIHSIITSGETLCRDNCQLIGMPFFRTRSAGKNNRN